MREILFRGKDDISGEWITGFLVDEKHIGNFVEANPIIPETVGQYTGLKDKNDKKIFEGDIVRTYRNEDTFDLMMAVWYEDSASFVLASQYGFYCCESLTNSHIYLEIIGNIHDNLELLRRKNE